MTYEHQFPVRPVKGTVEENADERILTPTSGDCIDLGLSVKWASCNAGADSPELEGTTFRASAHGWGGFDTSLWRMPTKEETEELVDNCTWTWGKYKGISGYQVTGPNGNSIFLPACEVPNKVGLYRVGTTGHGIGDYNIDYLGISSKNHVVTDYSILNVEYSDIRYCIRTVALE